jgi:hypothetical protein
MPGVHRHGDARQCGATTVVSNQDNVFANGKLIAVQGDQNTHGAGALNASINPGTVFINDLELVVNGSTAAVDGSGHLSTASASEGSTNVFAF